MNLMGSQMLGEYLLCQLSPQQSFCEIIVFFRIPVGVSETSWIVSLVSIGQIAGERRFCQFTKIYLEFLIAWMFSPKNFLGAILGAVLASLIGRKGQFLLRIRA